MLAVINNYSLCMSGIFNIAKRCTVAVNDRPKANKVEDMAGVNIDFYGTQFLDIALKPY